MASRTVLIFICSVVAVSLALPTQDSKVLTEPKPGQEYVFVQTSGSGSRPIARKEKPTENERPFETSHKLPASLTFALNQEEVKEEKPTKNSKVHKREANPGDAPAPAPPGAIKLNVAKLLEKYRQEIKTSTTDKPKTTTTTRRSRRKNTKRGKRDAVPATSPRPVLTTGRPVIQNIDPDDAPLLALGSEKQRSRIQVKKGPNGQDYEYEYVYYYYDDDEDTKDKNNGKVTNSHDGPARNTISRSDTREKPEVNEVLPSRGRPRGRQLEEDTVNEERLPANTRFPPRSRNLNTTPAPEDEEKLATKGRGRGRPTTDVTPEADSISDETQGSRGRTRANVRRPTLDLVDNDTFNTHTNAGATGGPSFPTDLPAGPDPESKLKESGPPAPVFENAEENQRTQTATADGEVTTIMSAMDKVALDLYAISQGTQKLFGEEGINDAPAESDQATTESSTEELETTTPTTTTTTTTTTTPKPTTTTTTTTTTEAPTTKGRFGGRRGGIGARKTTAAASTTTEASSASENKPKKFGRPSFGGRSRAKTTAAPVVEKEEHKEESKPTSQSRSTISRGRFGGSRPRGRTTAATEEPKDDSSSSTSAPASNRPSLPRARPSFNLRTRGRTTAAPPTEGVDNNGDETSATSSSEASSTTARTRRLQGGGAVKPLRPGPRINLSGRRGGSTTTTTTEAAPVEDHATGEDEQETPAEAASEKEEAPAAPVDNSPLGRLRNRNRLNVQPVRPKAAASTPVQVRRVNPLIARRRPGQSTEAPSSENPVESSPATESAEEAEETEASSPSSSSTTEEPRGLNKLLAGRRRAGIRTPGTLNH